MNTSKLAMLCGSIIVDVKSTKNEIGIKFNTGVDLIIYNDFKCAGFGKKDIKLLTGRLVVDVDDRETMITIKFENACSIMIDMQDEAYRGPEAIQLRIPNQAIVIWN